MLAPTRKLGRRLLVGLAMVAPGAVQAGIGAIGGEAAHAGLDVVYSLVSVARPWFEGPGLRR